MLRILIVTAIATAWGQGVAPRGLTLKANPAAYEFSGDAGKLQIGAVYMGRSFSAGPKMHDAGNFIVVEVGVFAAKDFTGELSAGDFQLKIDGKKTVLLATAPGLVANSLRNRDIDPQRPRLVYGGGIGDAQVMVGQPRPQARFPGDPRPGQQRPIGMPTTTDSDAQDWDVAIESALPEGPLQSGRAGNLYFDYPGKMTKVKSLVLQYSGPGGNLELRLR
jgi:hypothetical protein